ncbi:MAG TPA: aldo/keto reductase [Polyangiaceae bacterium]|nr:aldo/keto reductase [Polyangiaceae bacterium]
MALEQRRLGTTDLRLSTLGFGSWAIGGADWAYGWGAQDDESSIATILRAVSRGVNWIDTAAIYGLGHSETVVGRALQRIPPSERPLVFTKCGMEVDPANPRAEPTRNLQPAAIRKECEASLRRLGVDRIDLYQFHWPDALGTPVEDSWGTMAELVTEGKVRAIGVSNFSTELLERAAKVRRIDSVQPPFSLLARGSADAVIPWAKAHGAGVIVYSPLGSGILTSAFSAARAAALSPDDWRRKAASFQEPALSRNLAVRAGLLPIAERHGCDVSAIALSWVLGWPGVTGAIVGARRPDQVDGWLQTQDVKLSAADLEEIGRLLDTPN